jgi:hypothetical protein
VRDLVALMEAAGFAHVEYVGKTGVATSRYTLGTAFRARK